MISVAWQLSLKIALNQQTTKSKISFHEKVCFWAMKIYSVFHLAHINWNKVFHLGYRNISLHLLTWSGTPEVNIAMAGNVNDCFFQLDFLFWKSTWFWQIHECNFMAVKLTLKSLAKASRVVLQDDTWVELIGMESLLGENGKIYMIIWSSSFYADIKIISNLGISLS